MKQAKTLSNILFILAGICLVSSFIAPTELWQAIWSVKFSIYFTGACLLWSQQ